jgi:hypothetical protein
MKKIIWFSSLAIIFLNMIIAIFLNDYPLVNNILLNFSIAAILFMFYVIFFEKKTSAVIRAVSIVFGLAGLARVVFEIISVQSFESRAILLGLTAATLLIVFVPVVVQNAMKE